MSLRAYVAGVEAGTCPAPGPLVAGNKCSTFYLAKVDPEYHDRQLVITLFDAGEGAQRIRVRGPNGSKMAFDWKTRDNWPVRSGSVPSASSGLDVSATSPPPSLPATNNFNDRRVDLTVTLPDSNSLKVDGGWFKVEYEVSPTALASGLTDLTTWSASVRGAPVHLVQ